MATTLVWNKRLVIGHPIIDQQHHTLIDLANTVLNVRHQDEQEERNLLRSAVRQLYAYIETHFASEEQLLATINYQDLDDHRDQHGQIITELNRIMSTSNSLPTLHENLRSLLTIWIVEHILKHDMAYRDALLAAPSDLVGTHTVSESLT